MKLISINIERDKHFGTVIPFIETERPDVLCLQEVFQNDLYRFETLGYTCTFLPMTIFISNNTEQILGIALCSRTPLHNMHSQYYLDLGDILRVHDSNDIVHTVRYGYIGGNILHDDTIYPIITTHFTWTPNGERPSLEQIESLETLFALTAHMKPHSICGDFNIPRHTSHLYEKLATQYTDNIPPEYTSSLDKQFHRLGDSPDRAHLFSSFMVDYVFTQPPYHATDVRLVFGLSDHAAVMATLSKRI